MAAGGGLDNDKVSERSLGRSLIFVAILTFYWFTLQPFPDLSAASLVDPWGANSNVINQFLSTAIIVVLVAFAWRHPLRHQIAQPRFLIAATFGWFTITSLMADDPGIALRRVVIGLMVVIGTSIFLLLPRDEKHFAKLLGGTLLALLGVAYFGVIFMPLRSIHQVTDVVEPMLAGDWRGFLGHKNITAPAMAFTVFVGMFVWNRWSRAIGAVMVVFALIFLFKTGGKTSLGMVPAVLALAWAFEHWRRLRLLIVLGGLSLLNIGSVGAAVWEPVSKFIGGLGIDATFTDRVAVWRLALDSLSHRPLTGFGMSSFWQTESLIYGGSDLNTWAITASNAHNGYLDAAMSGGIPGLILVVAWLVISPINDVAAAETTGNDKALTRLFLRFWIYGIFAASLESFFFVNSGPIWFTILIGVFGLRYQRRSHLVAQTVPMRAEPAYV